MRGMELAERYYEAFGPELRRQFPALMEKTAVGLCGAGSECWGFDDEQSADHDFEPGFCLFIPDDTDRQTAFALERAYKKLPGEFLGCRRCGLDPVGGSRHGVIRVSEFFKEYVGRSTLPQIGFDWLVLGEDELSAAVNGRLFEPGDGVFKALQAGFRAMPEDVRRKKLAAHLTLMAQAGPYNYVRCAGRGETGAAVLALARYTEHALCAFHLTEGAYCPYYKWAMRSFRELGTRPELADAMTYLLDAENGPEEQKTKAAVMEDLDRILLELLAEKGLIAPMPAGRETDLEIGGRRLQERIGSAELRQLHIMAGV